MLPSLNFAADCKLITVLATCRAQYEWGRGKPWDGPRPEGNPPKGGGASRLTVSFDSFDSSSLTSAVDGHLFCGIGTITCKGTEKVGLAEYKNKGICYEMAIKIIQI